METLQKTKFSIIRNYVRLIEDSIKNNYLDEEWKQRITHNLIRCYEEIVLTESGYYAIEEECALIDNEYYHRETDEDIICWDEINEEFILQEDSREVYTRNGCIYTHIDNCNGCNEIYYYQGNYIDDGYMERNSLIFNSDGNIRHLDDVYYWESDGEYHDEPYEDEDEEEENSLIQSYSYRPSLQFHKMPFDNINSPFFGIELEVERKNSNSIKHNDMCELIKDNHWYFKTDGSLTDGFEIVTHPMSFSYIKHIEPKLISSFKLLVENSYNSYNANTCGIHIHISKSSFTTWHLYRFMKFFVENKEFIISISQRNIDKLKRWANIEDNSNDELIYKAKKKDGNSARYVAINLQNNKTIEVRIFRGTLNFNSFMKNIEFIHSLFMYTKDSNEITLNGYKQYIDSSCEYSNLKKFINLKNL